MSDELSVTFDAEHGRTVVMAKVPEDFISDVLCVLGGDFKDHPGSPVIRATLFDHPKSKGDIGTECQLVIDYETVVGVAKKIGIEVT
jgi:hypothetical protein